MTYAAKEDKEQMTETVKERTTPPVDKPDVKKTATSQSSMKSAESTSVKKSKKESRTQWTDESMRAYLEDYSHMSVSAMSSKYGIAKKSVSQYVYLFRKKLEIPKN